MPLSPKCLLLVKKKMLIRVSRLAQHMKCPGRTLVPLVFSKTGPASGSAQFFLNIRFNKMVSPSNLEISNLHIMCYTAEKELPLSEAKCE